jgi:YjjG family noncanonical pyrimidine nucleotidase
MKGITHVFFDLDHTLWDYESNSKKVLLDLYEVFELSNQVKTSSEEFLNIYSQVNDQFWEDFDLGKIDKEYLRIERFQTVLRTCGATDVSNWSKLNDYFLMHCPRQKAIMDGATDVLDYLLGKYQLAIITNGFDAIQEQKLRHSGLSKYFSHIYTSETIGKKKPDAAIFEHAMRELGAHAHQTIMIGDNLNTDVGGAKNANILPIHFNPLRAVHNHCEWQISHLSELLKIL